MKSLLLLCLVGLAVASYPGSGVGLNSLPYREGKQYVFEYSGRLLSGLPELNSLQFSGVGIKCKVHMSVISGGQGQGPVRFSIRISEAKYVRLNHKLEPRQDSGPQAIPNWRYLPLGEYTRVPSEMESFLSNPTRVEMRENGEFEHMVVGGDEPEWSINLKKGLVALFQTKFSTSGSVNTEVETNSLSGSSGSGPVTDSWTGQEMGLDGTCQVSYQLNELPHYMLKDGGSPLNGGSTVARNWCEGTKAFELIKTRDVNSCSKRTSFSYYKPGSFNCATGNCEGMWSRSSVTKYIACGTGRSDLEIRSIINEGELSQALMGYNTEKFVTGTRLNLTLLHTESVSGGEGHAIRGGEQVLRTLYYEYGTGSRGSSSSSGIQSGIEGIEGINGMPRHTLTTGGKRVTGGRKEELITQIKAHLKQVVDEDLVDPVGLPSKQITMKILTVARGMALIGKSDIEQIYGELKNEFSGDELKKHTFKNLFFDTVTIGGTHECIRFMKERISRGEVSTSQMMTFFNNLPNYMLAPKQEILEELFSFITTEQKIKQEPLVHHNVILSFSVLVQKACIADNRQTSYPTWVWGSNCSPESRIVTEKWLPYLQTILRETGEGRKSLKNAIIVSLGHMTHKNVIPILLPFVESGTSSGISGSGSGSGPEEESWNRLPRLLATYSLSNAGKKYPHLVIPVLMSIFGNQGENTEVRTAALNVLLKLNPPMWVIQNIATSTWYEKDTQVLKAVNTALFTISTSQEVSDVSGTYVSLQKKAWLVYPMIKRTGGRMPTTGMLFGSEELRELGVGYQYLTTWVASKDSFWPQSYYVKLVYFLERFQFSPLEVGLKINNGKSLISQLVKIISSEGGLSSGPTGEELDEKIKTEVHREWRQVIDKLNIKTRRSGEKVDASLYFNLFEDSPYFFNFESTSINELRSKVSGLLGSSDVKQGLKASICGQKEINWQRMMDLAPTEVTIPSDMGLPIVVELHMPTLISSRGSFHGDCQTSIPKVTLKSHMVFASQLTGWVGTICPFTKDIVVTGVDEHVIVNLPIELGLEVNIEENRIRSWMKPLNQQRLSQPMDLIHFHIRPYTVAQNWWSLTPMTVSRNVKFINANGENGQKSKSFNFGGIFGVSLKAVVTSETPFLDFRSVWEKVRMLHYNPMNLLRFGWTNTGLRESGLPSLRRHEVQLRYDPSQSTTSEVDFTMDINVLSKNKDNGGSPIKMHKVRVEEREGKVLPYKIESTGPSSEPKIVKLKELLERTGLEYGTGLGLKLTWVLKSTGGRPRTFSYVANIVGGNQGSYKSKWNGHFECQTSGKKVCVNGDVTWNGLPLWNIEELRNSGNEFRFKNLIGFGQQCSDHQIDVTGTSKTSDRQKEFSRISREAVALRKMIEQGAPVAKLSDIAEIVRMQATTLDEVDFKVEYQNAPFWVKKGSEYFIQGVKAWLWPYTTSGPHSGSHSGSESGIGGSGSSWRNFWTIRFEPKTRSFTLTLNRPGLDGVTKFEHVRMPYPTEFFLPMNGIKSPLKVAAKKILGAPIHPVCSLEKDWSKTYDNRTVKTVIDDCYHLLSADCSVHKTFAVLVKNLEGKSRPDGPKKIKAFIGKSTEVVLKPSSAHSRYMTSIEVSINGTRLSIGRGGSVKSIVDVKGQVIGSVEEKRDGGIVLKTPEVSIAFDGFKARVEASVGLKNELCGLCGDANGQKIADVRGPKKCVFSKPELVSASYRVGSLGGSTCAPLPGHIERELSEEKSQCLKYAEIPTKVSKSFLAKSGACTQHRHELIEEPSRICFSRRPVIACGDACTPSGSLVRKTVSFGCMPKNRLGQRYAEEVRQGKILSELGQISESFSIEMPLPASCKPINPRV